MHDVEDAVGWLHEASMGVLTVWRGDGWDVIASSLSKCAETATGESDDGFDVLWATIVGNTTS